MNKQIILSAIILVAAVAIGWFVLNPGDTFDYVVTVDQEINQMEDELAEIEAAVEAGTLTEEQATEAKIKILTRLETINTSMEAAGSAKLTPAQRIQLNEGLDRLKNILITYQATLTVVDETAVESEVQARVITRSSSNGNKKLSLEIADTIDTVEETAVEVIEDYTPDAELDAQVDVIVEEETEVNVVTEEETEVAGEETTDITTTDESGMNTTEDNSAETQSEDTMDEPIDEEMETNDTEDEISIDLDTEVEITQ